MVSNSSNNRPAIKDIISGQASIHVSGMSERELADLLAPISGVSGGTFYGSMKVAQTLGTAMGIKNTKKIEKSYPHPYQYATIVLGYFFAMRRMELEIIALYDTPHGSVMEAKMPTDIFSPGGSLSFETRDESPSRIVVIGESEVKGQMYDWGKGMRTLRNVCDSAEQYIRRMAP